MPVCPHCGHETRSSDRFCNHCGRLMDVATESSVGPLALRASGRELNGRSLNQANGQVNQPAHAPISGAGTPGGTSRPAPALARLVLQVRAGSGQTLQEVPMDGRDITIGRAPGCDVVLPDDPLASRRHSLLRFDGQRYTIADLGSSNGTYVNDVEIHEVTPLNPGDRITVGEHEYLYLAPDPVSAAGESGVERFNTDGFQIRTPPSFSTAAPLMSGQPAAPASPPVASDADPRPPVVTLKAPVVSVGQPPAVPATPASPAAPASPDAGSAAGAPRAGDSMERDIEDLRARLLEVSSALARRSEGAEQVTRRLRDIMTGLRAQVDQALALPGARGEASPQGDDANAHVDELLGLVRNAADNPRHLDHVTALAGRADDLANTLQAQQRRIGALETARTGMVAALEELRARLSSLIEDEGQRGGETP